ncbi:hypothetical protein GQ53DRAFT_765236 [Thozetella sp. PMI_491]|nr:hypothetical protein GQ53DRAFT_765236 [Thozetella sp. PMI_491]
MKTTATLFYLLGLCLGISANSAFGNSTLRYIPGEISIVVKTLETDPEGVFSVGKDGILRSFGADGHVVDWRQLDPAQFSKFAELQLAGWTASSFDVPDTVTALAESPDVDGRLVTDLEDILHPADLPNLPLPSGGHPSPRAAEKEIVDRLLNRQACLLTPCSALTCPAPCMACFFPGGPPVGICLI